MYVVAISSTYNGGLVAIISRQTLSVRARFHLGTNQRARSCDHARMKSAHVHAQSVYQESGNVGEWQVRDDAVLLSAPVVLGKGRHHTFGLENYVVMGDHDSFWVTGRAAGIDQCTHVAWSLLCDDHFQSVIANVFRILEKSECEVESSVIKCIRKPMTCDQLYSAYRHGLEVPCADYSKTGTGLSQLSCRYSCRCPTRSRL